MNNSATSSEETRLDPTIALTIFAAIHEEVCRARAQYPKLANEYEGVARIQAETGDLWNATHIQRDLIAMRTEAIQVAAMAIRFLYDLTETTR